ncbi:MAG: ABC transporter substrate-binding protein [Hyphomonadaceae bacterium]
MLRAALCAALASVCLNAPAAAQAPAKPQRIVSTNLCTDQMLLYLVEPERIISLTYLSWKNDATPPRFRDALSRIKPNHGLAEEVLRMDPDLVIAGAYSARFTTSLLRRLGKDVVEFEPDNSFDDMYADFRKMGDLVGERERAETLIRDFQTELARLEADSPAGDKPVYAAFEPNMGVVGKDMFLSEVVNAGGFQTLGEAMGFSGYRNLPIEQIVQLTPDLISTDPGYGSPAMATDILRHPLMRRMTATIPELNIPPRYTNCPTPETLEAVRMLVEARKRLRAQPRGSAPKATLIQ